MKADRNLLVQTARVGAGVLALTAVMLAIYALSGQFSLSALWGGLYTSALTILNFFVMGLTVGQIADIAAEKTRTDEEIAELKKQMQARMRLSYTGRMVVLFALVAVGITVLNFEPLSTILPLIFPRLAIGGLQWIDQKRSKGGAEP